MKKKIYIFWGKVHFLGEKIIINLSFKPNFPISGRFSEVYMIVSLTTYIFENRPFEDNELILLPGLKGSNFFYLFCSILSSKEKLIAF